MLQKYNSVCSTPSFVTKSRCLGFDLKFETFIWKEVADKVWSLNSDRVGNGNKVVQGGEENGQKGRKTHRIFLRNQLHKTKQEVTKNYFHLK